jgi:hypothetical protein
VQGRVQAQKAQVNAQSVNRHQSSCSIRGCRTAAQAGRRPGLMMMAVVRARRCCCSGTLCRRSAGPSALWTASTGYCLQDLHRCAPRHAPPPQRLAVNHLIVKRNPPFAHSRHCWLRACTVCATLMVGWRADACSFLTTGGPRGGCVSAVRGGIAGGGWAAADAADVLPLVPGLGCEHEHDVNALPSSVMSVTAATAFSTESGSVAADGGSPPSESKGGIASTITNLPTRELLYLCVSLVLVLGVCSVRAGWLLGQKGEASRARGRVGCCWHGYWSGTGSGKVVRSMCVWEIAAPVMMIDSLLDGGDDSDGGDGVEDDGAMI